MNGIEVTRHWLLTSVAWLLLVVLAGCSHAPPRPSVETTHPAPPSNTSATRPATTAPAAHSVRERLLAHYRQWRHTPHRLGGDSHKGIDCSAYTRRIYRDLFGVTLPRTARAQGRTGIAVRKSDLAVGDLVFFKPGRFTDHVGVYLGDGSFIHVSSSHGVIRSRLDNVYWRKHYRFARRIIRFATGSPSARSLAR